MSESPRPMASSLGEACWPRGVSWEVVVDIVVPVLFLMRRARVGGSSSPAGAEPEAWALARVSIRLRRRGAGVVFATVYCKRRISPPICCRQVSTTGF